MKACKTLIFTLLLAGAHSTSNTVQNDENVFLVRFNEVYDFANLKHGHIADATEAALKNAEEILQKILTVDKENRSFENTLEKIDDIYATIEMVWSPSISSSDKKSVSW